MPSVMGSLMRMDNQSGGAPEIDPLLLEEDGDVSIASDLTNHPEQHGYGGVSGGTTTLLEAMAGLPRTLVGYPLDNGGTPGEPPTAPRVAMNGEDRENNQDDGTSSIDLSVNRSAQGNLSGNGNADEAPATPTADGGDFQLRNVIVELPQPSGLEPSQASDPSQQSDETNEEYDLEGRLLAEAASAAVATFSAQASAAARETASEAVVATSSWGIWAGALTGDRKSVV